MPGFGSTAGIPAARLPAATVVAELWIGDRLLMPISNLERRACNAWRREDETGLEATRNVPKNTPGL